MVDLAVPRASTTACVQPPLGEKYGEIVGVDGPACIGRENRRTCRKMP